MKIECDPTELASLLPGLGRRHRKRARPEHAQVRRLDAGPVMKLSQSAYLEIMAQIAEQPPERGGILLGPVGEYIATHFVVDHTGRGTGASWTFGHQRINEILAQYVSVRMEMLGFIHSHPPTCRFLSSQDIADFQKPFRNAKNPNLHEVWAPIVVDKTIYPYILYRDNPNQPSVAQLVLI